MFPVGMSLAEVKEVVTSHNKVLGTDAFIIAERGEYTIFNYVVSFDGTFPEYTGDPERDRAIGILRECRGLTFHTQSGVLAARKFHKFFNVNQRAETQAHVIDWTQSHTIMEKLDGSMITPVGHFKSREWHTKMGATDVAQQVEAFVAENPIYNELADMCCIANKTPIFEWCSRQQRIVIDYPTDQLVLLAVRDNHSGQYATNDELAGLASIYGIPTVAVAKTAVFDVERFMEHTRALKGQEGYVIKFESGLMVKMKAEEYCLQHAAKEGLELEKNVWALILSDVLDDQLSLMTPDDRDTVTSFANAFYVAIATKAEEVRGGFEVLINTIDQTLDDKERKKQFALAVMKSEVSHPAYKGLMFAAYDGRDLAAEIRKLLSKSCGNATAVEDARHLVGIRWADFRYGTKEAN